MASDRNRSKFSRIIYPASITVTVLFSIFIAHALAKKYF